ncbi:MAG: alpha/beta fold hydrolase [Actinomycetes bacterium]
MSAPPVTARVSANGVEIAYETFGDAADPPVLLAMGLGTQMLAWPDPMCQALAERGHHVVRFDNRDVGLSTHLEGTPPPRFVDALVRRRRLPYRIDDMGDDALGLMDALGMPAAHLVGASMGGFIVQSIALRAPERVRSLTLMMSSTGSRTVGQPRARLVSRLFRREVAEREGVMDAAVETFRAIGSQGYALDEEYLRDLAARSYDRAHDPAGYRRQLAAVTAQANRTRALRGLRLPTVVLHGLHDPLISVTGGLALARTIPGARFVGFSGMGHDLPRELWPRFVDEIAGLAARADEEAVA